MKRSIGFLALFLWTAIACSLQLALLGFMPRVDLVGSVLSRALIPDLSTILLVATIGRLDRRDALWIAMAVAASRVAFTSSPPAAVLSGTIATAYIAEALSRLSEMDRPFLRIVGAGLGSLVFSAWLLFVDFAHMSEAQARGGLSFGSVGGEVVAVPFLTAASSAAIAFALWPIFRHLPGLGRLERRAF